MDITADTLVSDILAADPRAAAVLHARGLGCSSCLASQAETLAEAAAMHGLSVRDLIEDLLSLDVRDVRPQGPEKESA